MRKPKPSNQRVIGLTGSFGTGKSTVAKILRSCGALVIDADKISHGLIKPDGAAYSRVIRLLGKRIVNSQGIINRGKLAGIVFSDKKSLAEFNKIMHPAVIRRMKQEIKEAKEKIVVLDAPLLIETGLNKLVDSVVVVKASLANQLKRVQKKRGLSRPEIIARIRAQIPLKEKLRSADFVIDNNGTLSNTRKQVALIRRLWWRS